MADGVEDEAVEVAHDEDDDGVGEDGEDEYLRQLIQDVFVVEHVRSLVDQRYPQQAQLILIYDEIPLQMKLNVVFEASDDTAHDNEDDVVGDEFADPFEELSFIKNEESDGGEEGEHENVGHVARDWSEDEGGDVEDQIYSRVLGVVLIMIRNLNSSNDVVFVNNIIELVVVVVYLNESTNSFFISLVHYYLISEGEDWFL